MTLVAHEFESPHTTQTLAQGLAEYFAANPMLKRSADLLSPEARQFFHSHDVVHVVFGCGTSMPDEAIVKLVSIFGTTGGLGVLRGYLNHETLDIYRKLPLGSTVLALLMATGDAARAAPLSGLQQLRPANHCPSLPAPVTGNSALICPVPELPKYGVMISTPAS